MLTTAIFIALWHTLCHQYLCNYFLPVLLREHTFVIIVSVHYIMRMCLLDIVGKEVVGNVQTQSYNIHLLYFQKF